MLKEIELQVKTFNNVVISFCDVCVCAFFVRENMNFLFFFVPAKYKDAHVLLTLWRRRGLLTILPLKKLYEKMNRVGLHILQLHF